MTGNANMTPAACRGRTRKAASFLARAYPRAVCALRFSSPLDLLVATILSAQCTDERVNMVTKQLFAKYRSAADYAKADPAVFMEEIKSTGFFRNKARHIIAAAAMLAGNHCGEVPRSMDDLLELPGVARKTANVVLGSAYGIISGIVVDTHVIRLSSRLGLSSEKDPVKIERDLMAAVPRAQWISFGHRLTAHGRSVCHARSPECLACGMRSFCLYPGRES